MAAAVWLLRFRGPNTLLNRPHGPPACRNSHRVCLVSRVLHVKTIDREIGCRLVVAFRGSSFGKRKALCGIRAAARRALDRLAR